MNIAGDQIILELTFVRLILVNFDLECLIGSKDSGEERRKKNKLEIFGESISRHFKSHIST